MGPLKVRTTGRCATRSGVHLIARKAGVLRCLQPSGRYQVPCRFGRLALD